MKGIDIYSGQGSVDFKAVKASGIEIVYIKATEGVTYTDPTVRNFYNGAKAAGLKVGFYHFLRANNPVSEAQHFLDIVKDLPADCKYAIDVEIVLGQTAQQLQNNVRQFADCLKQHGKETVIYTYRSFFKEYLNIIDIPLWIAEYGVSKPKIDVPYVGFQYSETGRIPGISGNVDLDEFSEGIFIGNVSTVQFVKLAAEAPKRVVNDTIKIIQQQLNTLLKKGLAVDGIEGPATTTAIKEFQGIMGLSVDAIWGPKTAGVVGQIYSKPLAKIGSNNTYAVRYIQHRMGITVDGIFGNQTKISVQNWQAKNGLAADGIVGPKTWEKLFK